MTGTPALFSTSASRSDSGSSPRNYAIWADCFGTLELDFAEESAKPRQAQAAGEQAAPPQCASATSRTEHRTVTVHVRDANHQISTLDQRLEGGGAATCRVATVKLEGVAVTGRDGREALLSALYTADDSNMHDPTASWLMLEPALFVG